MAESANNTLTHPELGVLTWFQLLQWWQAGIDLPMIRNKQVGIAANPDLDLHLRLATRFLEWLPTNYEIFIERTVEAAFDFDLIRDEDIDESKLESMLKIDEVNVSDGVLHVWLDAGGATTDHLIQTKLDEQHEITEMRI